MLGVQIPSQKVVWMSRDRYIYINRDYKNPLLTHQYISWFMSQTRGLVLITEVSCLDAPWLLGHKMHTLLHLGGSAHNQGRGAWSFGVFVGVFFVEKKKSMRKGEVSRDLTLEMVSNKVKSV